MEFKEEILRTQEVIARFKISRSTLHFWRTPARMPKQFSRPFPPPTIPGKPDRWRLSEIMKWEDEVNSLPVAYQQPSQDAHAKPSASDAGLQDSREGCNEP